MKIYYKSNFFLGLFFVILGIAMLIVSVFKGFDMKGGIIMILCLLFGGGMIIRSLSASMSREDKISKLDERNDLIKKKSRSVAFMWSEGICAVCLVGFMAGHSVIGEVVSVPMTIAFGMMLSVMFLLELITTIYYNRNM